MNPRVLAVGIMGVVEVYLFQRYRWLGSEFHFWLHGLFGAALGVGLLTLVELTRGPSRRRSVLAAGFVGHLYSAMPDVLFLGAGILHYMWMDAFAFHIALHFIPAPLATMLGVFTLALAGWGCAVLGRRRLATVALVAAALVTGGALLVRAPLPATLTEVRAAPGLTLLCPVTDNIVATSAELPPDSG